MVSPDRLRRVRRPACSPKAVLVRPLNTGQSVRVGDALPIDADGSVFRARTSPLLLTAIGLVFVAFGVWGLVAWDSPGGRIVCAVWLAGVVWWTGFAFAYDVVLVANGEITFRSLLRHRVTTVASVTKVTKAYGEGTTWLVVRYRGGRASMGAGEDEVEFVRRLMKMNPEIEADPQIFK